MNKEMDIKNMKWIEWRWFTNSRSI